MVKYIILALFNMIVWLHIINAQVKLAGKIIDQTNKPLVFASILILQDSVVLGGASNEKGVFSIAGNFHLDQIYTIQVSLVGYQPFEKKFTYADTFFLSAITLIPDKNLLNNVIITANKPLITKKTDRTIINVENSFLANGNTALDVLQKTPGIWMDNNGNIHIKGNTPVMVMINDVVQRMSQEDLKDYLKTLKSEDISKIEIISNPPSEYEAEGLGGIVHIILKKKRKTGLDVAVNGQYRQQKNKPYWASGLSLDYKIKNLYLFGNYSINSDIKPVTETSQIIFNNTRFFNNATIRTDNYFRQQYRVGLALDLNKNQTLGLQTNAYAIAFNQLLFTSIVDRTANSVTIGASNANRHRNVVFNTTTFNYLYKLDTIGSALKIIGDYSNNYKTETSKFYEFYSDTSQNSIYRNNVPNSTKIGSIQADYTKNFNTKTALKIGIKYVAIERDNEIIKEDSINNGWLKNNAASDHFAYNEKLWMGYSSFEKKLHETDIKIGLRAEETESKGNSITTTQQFIKYYLGFFPSLYITQILNETKGNSVYLNYSRRITRPTLSDLNPNKIQFSSNTATIGDPNLRPQFSHNIEVGGTLLNKFNGDIYFTKTTDIITVLANSDSNNFINYKSVNLNNSTEYGLNLTVPFKIFKNWSVLNSLQANNLSYTLNEQIVHQTRLSVQSVHTINLKNIVDVDVVASYRSASQYSNIANPALGYFDVGFTKKMLQDKATLRLYCSDIFNAISEKEFTTEPDLYIYFYRKRASRLISLSFNYNFSIGKKFKQKKIEQSENDARSRIGN